MASLPLNTAPLRGPTSDEDKLLGSLAASTRLSSKSPFRKSGARSPNPATIYSKPVGQPATFFFLLFISLDPPWKCREYRKLAKKKTFF